MYLLNSLLVILYLFIILSI